MKMRSSIHIITRDRTNNLSILLGSLVNQTTKEFDVVILDNGRQFKVAQDYNCRAILERLKLEGVRINVVETQEEHRDIGKYRNQCIAEDKFNNSIGIRIDDDSLLEPNFVEILSNGFTSDDIGVVGCICPYLFYPRTYILQPARYNEITDNFEWVDNCVNFTRFINDDGTDRHYSKTYFPSGHIRSNYAYRMDLVREIKFPEWSGASGFTEETVFCIKAQISGYRVIINPNAVAWHFAVPSGGGRDKVQSQQQMDTIKVYNLNRLKKELEEYRKEKGVDTRGYP